jgi:hypothetical protein
VAVGEDEAVGSLICGSTLSVVLGINGKNEITIMAIIAIAMIHFVFLFRWKGFFLKMLFLGCSAEVERTLKHFLRLKE